MPAPMQGKKRRLDIHFAADRPKGANDRPWPVPHEPQNVIGNPQREIGIAVIAQAAAPGPDRLLAVSEYRINRSRGGGFCVG